MVGLEAREAFRSLADVEIVVYLKCGGDGTWFAIECSLDNRFGGNHVWAWYSWEKAEKCYGFRPHVPRPEYGWFREKLWKSIKTNS